jgi:hypothetical protein
MTTEIRSRNSRNQMSCKASTHSFVSIAMDIRHDLHLLAVSVRFEESCLLLDMVFTMSDIPPRFGFALAGQQPTPVPLFSSFDWASDLEPEGDPRDFFALLFCGKVPSENLASDLDMAATFALTAQALKGAFEELYLHFIGAAATQAPAHCSSPPLPMTIGSSKVRYHLLSIHAVGGFLAVAWFWIPPMSSADAEGTWSDPILMVIGAPTTTVDAQPVSRLAVWPESGDPEFKLQPGGFPGAVETDLTILAGTIAAGTHIIPLMGHWTWQEYRELPGHVWCFLGLDACAVRSASWFSGSITHPTSWSTIVNDANIIRSSLPADALDFDGDGAPTDDDTQLCVMSKLLPLPPFHGLPMGQIFDINLGAEGFSSALDIMAPGLSDELGYLQHPLFC